MISTVLALGLIFAAPGPSLEQAQRQADDFDYVGALKTLDGVLAREGNDRATMLALYELQGVVFGSLNKPAKARAAFVVLLSLDPTHTLSGDHPPRVRTPFYEAKDEVARAGALSLAHVPPTIEADQVVRIAARVDHDALKLVKGVRLHYRIGDPEKTTVLSPDPKGTAAVATVAGEVRWWAEALGEKDAVLVVLGQADQPLIDRAVPLPVAAPPAPAPAVALGPPPPAARTRWVRPAGVAAAIAGVGALGIGSYFGLTANAARSSITNATRDGTGAINGLTQVQAAAADRRAQDSALIANALFGVGAGLAGLGIVLFVVGDGPTSATVTPAGPGVTVQGTF